MSVLFRPQTMNYASSWSDTHTRRANTVPGAMHVTFNDLPNDYAQAQATIPLRKRTQKDQDNADEEAKRKAMKDLVQSWMDRLQLIGVMTTFFASAEAGMLQITTPDVGASMTAIQTATNATLVGALVMHVFAAIVSFLASFVLIRYKLKEARKEEIKAEHSVIKSPITDSPQDVEKEGNRRDSGLGSHCGDRTPSEPPIFSSDPHIVQVGPFRRSPPTHLLSRCHSLCVFVASVGFLLALTGILCFAWARLPQSVGVFASAAMGFCLIAGVLIILVS